MIYCSKNTKTNMKKTKIVQIYKVMKQQ